MATSVHNSCDLANNVLENKEFKCIHCKKKVVSVVQCRKCKRHFHNSCLVQAAGQKSAKCKHEAKKETQWNMETICNEVEKLTIEMEYFKKETNTRMESLRKLLKEQQQEINTLKKTIKSFKEKKQCQCGEQEDGSKDGSDDIIQLF